VISFRYHLVSIIAVFLALALGIVVGTTALNGPITKDLRHQVDALKSDRNSLSDQVKQLQSQVGNGEKFGAMYGAQIVHGTLHEANVLIIGMPGASSQVKDGLATEIAAAGGKVTGRLQLTGDYVDPKQGAHAVVAGDTASAKESGVVAMVRGDSSDRSAVATVDDSDTALGQVSTVLALAEVGKPQPNTVVGHYGTASSAKALFPDPPK